MTLHTSYDNGLTWELVSVVDPGQAIHQQPLFFDDAITTGPSAYSALIELPDGSVAILYERAPPPPKLVFIPQVKTIQFHISISSCSSGNQLSDCVDTASRQYH